MLCNQVRAVNARSINLSLNQQLAAVCIPLHRQDGIRLRCRPSNLSCEVFARRKINHAARSTADVPGLGQGGSVAVVHSQLHKEYAM